MLQIFLRRVVFPLLALPAMRIRNLPALFVRLARLPSSNISVDREIFDWMSDILTRIPQPRFTSDTWKQNIPVTKDL